ncbi:MAG: hypothetical protein GF347_00610 [Candidatus Moranbacteria bacterium]|nr:hypothetical protein [Candidatus Moranbacteria bacterium]
MEVNMPYFIDNVNGMYCVRKGEEGDPGQIIKCHKTKSEASDHLKALYANVSDAKSVIGDNISGNLAHDGDGRTPNREDLMGKKCKCPECGKEISIKADEKCGERKCPECEAKMGDKDEKDDKGDKNDKDDKKSIPDTFTSYKSGDTWRWYAVSNVAVEDREGEIITEKAYDDAIAHAYKTGDFGELDLVHVDGTDVGSCDLMTRVGPLLIEGGEWYTDERSSKVREVVTSSGDEAVSIKFRYDPKQFDGRKYLGGIQILKRTILPRELAASVGTAIAAAPGGQMKGIDERTKEALIDYGLTEDQIVALADAQKDVSGDVKQKRSLLEVIKSALGLSESEEEPKEVETPQTEEKTQEDEIDGDVEQSILKARDAISSIAMESAMEATKAVITEALNPILTYIEADKSWKEDIEKRVNEAGKSVETKVLERLSELPQAAKVRPTEVSANEVAPTEEVAPSTTQSFAKSLVADIERVVNDRVKGHYQV